MIEQKKSLSVQQPSGHLPILSWACHTGLMWKGWPQGANTGKDVLTLIFILTVLSRYGLADNRAFQEVQHRLAALFFNKELGYLDPSASWTYTGLLPTRWPIGISSSCSS